MTPMTSRVDSVISRTYSLLSSRNLLFSYSQKPTKLAPATYGSPVVEPNDAQFLLRTSLPTKTDHIRR